jgi:hypothetical protein
MLQHVEEGEEEDVVMEEDNFVKVEGVLIKQDFEQLIVDDTEVAKYTGLKCTTMQ